MTLYTRLSLASTLLALLVVTGFGILAYFLFVRQQEIQLHALLEQDLKRIAVLLDRPTLGASFTDSASTGFILQFVAPDGQVIMSWGGEALLPLAERPQILQLGEHSYLSSHAPWGATNGTIRLAHNISSAIRSRENLARSLFLSGLLVALAATLIAAVSTRRALQPLERVSSEARAIDPTAPGAIHYHGPKDEIHALAQALNTAMAAIRTRQDDERAFLLEVAHELASPLTLVNYHLVTVRSEHPQDSRLRAAAEAAQELLRTSQDLLVLARGELERPLELQAFALRDLLTRVADEYPDIRIHAATSGEVVGDPERLMQVIRNLVRNGVQAAGTATKVHVLLRSEGDQQVLEVLDEGPGMSEEILGRVFERHYSQGGGIGVGLTISKSLVEQHGGSIHASSKLGQGSCFEIRLASLASRLEPTSSPIPT